MDWDRGWEENRDRRHATPNVCTDRQTESQTGRRIHVTVPVTYDMHTQQPPYTYNSHRRQTQTHTITHTHTYTALVDNDNDDDNSQDYQQSPHTLLPSLAYFIDNTHHR
jgi:hypothetical protein